MNTLKTSLIFTVYNEEQSITRLLKSIDIQTQLPDEVVICDAGSKDRTIELINDWAETSHVELNLIISPKANISRGRNLAIQAAKYDLIVVTDGGCVLDKDWVKLIATPFAQDSKLDAVYGGTHAIGHTLVGRIFADFYNAKTHAETVTNTEHSSRSVAFTKRAWQAVEGYPEWLTLAGEDTLFFINLDKLGHTTIVRAAVVDWHHGTDTLRGLYRVHKRNSIGSGEANMWPLRFGGLVGIYVAAVAGLIIGIWLPWLAALTVIALIALWSRSSWLTFALDHNPVAFIVQPAIFAARDFGTVVGYIQGVKKRL